MMWRPIETAPRNGQRILLRRIMDPWKVVGYGYWASEKGIDGWIAFGLTETPGNLGLGAPDGWMPIPSGDDVIDPTTTLLARMAGALKPLATIAILIDDHDQRDPRSRPDDATIWQRNAYHRGDDDLTMRDLRTARKVMAEYAAMTGEMPDAQ